MGYMISCLHHNLVVVIRFIAKNGDNFDHHFVISGRTTPKGLI